MSFFKQAIIWLFLGCEVFNISSFSMDACLKGPGDKSAPASSWKEPGVWHRGEIFWALKARSLNVRKARAGVFKAQVKCCRNKLKQNRFPEQIILHQLSCVWNIRPLTLTSSKPTVYEVTFIIKGLWWHQFKWSAAAAFCLLCHLKSDFNDSQIQYFPCCLNRRNVTQILVPWFEFLSGSV